MSIFSLGSERSPEVVWPHGIEVESEYPLNSLDQGPNFVNQMPGQRMWSPINPRQQRKVRTPVLEIRYVLDRGVSRIGWGICFVFDGRVRCTGALGNQMRVR